MWRRPIYVYQAFVVLNKMNLIHNFPCYLRFIKYVYRNFSVQPQFFGNISRIRYFPTSVWPTIVNTPFQCKTFHLLFDQRTKQYAKAKTIRLHRKLRHRWLPHMYIYIIYRQVCFRVEIETQQVIIYCSLLFISYCILNW